MRQLTIFGALFFPCALLFTSEAPADSTKPNIVFILADDLGYGDVQCLNQHRGKIATPYLDRLATQGMTFNDAHAGASVCTPTRYGLLTGRYCFRTRLQTGVLDGGSEPPLIAEDQLTVAQMLQRSGYATACNGKWHLGFQVELPSVNEQAKDGSGGPPVGARITGGPTMRGFDYFWGCSHARTMSSLIENDRVVEQLTPIEMLPRLTQRTVDFIEAQVAEKKSQPFFLYVALTSPHLPLVPSDAWIGKSSIGAYGDFVMQTDDSVGRILHALDRHGVADNTLVIFTSDNGCAVQAGVEELEARGHFASAQYRGYKTDAWDGGHRVPFFVRWPGHVDPGSTSNAIVCLGDFMATTAELLGVHLPEAAAPDSVSFVASLLNGEAPDGRMDLVHHSSQGLFAIRAGPWKLILGGGSGGYGRPSNAEAAMQGLPDAQLYHVAIDPGETTNLIDTQRKEDYNFNPRGDIWNDSSKNAHWRNRLPNQPFFAVFNLMVTHQSQIFVDEKVYERNTNRLTPKQRRDSALAPLPPFHPDTPEFRKEWSRHYENVTAMDYQFGDLVAELEQDGVADNTIVFFFSDHGTGMPGIKMWAWGPSLRVPLMIRFPKKWAHLAPAQSGETTDRMVSFVDFAPTVLSLAGIDLPNYCQGSSFLDTKAGVPRDFIFGGKDRQSEMSETIRTVRDSRFQYLRNFRPHLAYGQFMSYNWRHPSMQAWECLHVEGKLSGAPARFFAPQKPVEELYDVRNDPWQIHNLSEDPRYSDELQRMRSLLAEQMRSTGDLGLLPEHEAHVRAEGSTLYVVTTDPRLNPLDRLLRAADLANQMDARNVDALVNLLRDDDAAIRWWGTTGLLALGAKAAPATSELLRALDDPSPDVRLASAECLARLGEVDRALNTIESALRIDDVFVRLTALNVALRLGPLARPLLPIIRQSTIESTTQKDSATYVNRMVKYLPTRLGQ